MSSLGGSGVARTAVKSVAGVGIVLGSGAFVIAPSSAVGGIAAEQGALGATQSFTATDLLAERDAEAQGASRSAERAAPAAVTAPTQERAALPEAVTVEPVAKPKPKPKPEPTEDEADKDAETAEPATDSQESQPEPEPTQTADQGVQTGAYGAEAAALGLGPNASKVYSAVRTQFPDMTNIGGYRAGDPGDHGTGRAVDIMVTGARGDQVNAWLEANAGSLNIKYIIWQQRIWFPSGESRMMEDRGSATANHYDHVHVSVY